MSLESADNVQGDIDEEHHEWDALDSTLGDIILGGALEALDSYSTSSSGSEVMEIKHHGSIESGSHH